MCVCVFHRVLLYDYQGMCKANTHSASGARPLLSVSILLSVLITSTRTQQSDTISVTWNTLHCCSCNPLWYDYMSGGLIDWADRQKRLGLHTMITMMVEDKICVSVTEMKGCHLDSFILFSPSFCFSFFPQPFYNLLAAMRWFLSNFLL